MANDFAVRIDGKPLRIGAFDIESLGLKAPWAYVVCACVKEVNPNNLNGKIHRFRIDDYDYKRDQDRGLLVDLFECLNSFDLILTWYGSRFDIPFIITRGLKFGLQPPDKNFRRDLCLCARGFGALGSNRLVTWDKWLFGKALKTGLTFEMMLEAIRGNKGAIDEYIDHCDRDVLSTERIYKRCMPVYGKLRRN